MSNFALTISPRHDLWWKGSKVSGSAYRLIRNHGLHHGTMLLNTDLDRLAGLLQPSPGHEHDHGMVTSVQSPVANLNISYDRWIEMICTHLIVQAEPISETEMQSEAGVRERYAQLTDTAWIFRLN